MMMRHASLLAARRGLSSAPAHTPATFTPFLREHGVVVLDGGLGTLLGADAQRHVLWGAQLLFGREGHETLLAAHRTFLESGADVISSGSYNASFELLSAANAFTNGMLPGGVISREASQLRFTNDILRASVELAKKARNDFWTELKESGNPTGRPRPLVAASVGPVGDNTVPFTGATDPSTSVHSVPDDVAAVYYQRKLLSLCKAMPDLLAIETLPSLREARVALGALREIAPELARHGLSVPPCWVSFICRDEAATAAGDDFGEAVADLWRGEHNPAHLLALGLNCTAPALAEPLLRRAKAACPEATLLAYPNSGEVWDAREGYRCWRGVDADRGVGASYARALREAGAVAIGGCCNVTAEQIREWRGSFRPSCV